MAPATEIVHVPAHHLKKVQQMQANTRLIELYLQKLHDLPDVPQAPTTDTRPPSRVYIRDPITHRPVLAPSITPKISVVDDYIKKIKFYWQLKDETRVISDKDWIAWVVARPKFREAYGDAVPGSVDDIGKKQSANTKRNRELLLPRKQPEVNLCPDKLQAPSPVHHKFSKADNTSQAPLPLDPDSSSTEPCLHRLDPSTTQQKLAQLTSDSPAPQEPSNQSIPSYLPQPPQIATTDPTTTERLRFLMELPDLPASELARQKYLEDWKSLTYATDGQPIQTSIEIYEWMTSRPTVASYLNRLLEKRGFATGSKGVGDYLSN